MRAICPFLIAIALCSAAIGSAATTNADQPDQRAVKQATFTLWQLPEQTRSQMMSYVIRTTGGKVIVIDGGTTGDAPYLLKFLAGLGNNVPAWFVTHPHSDHVEALAEILRHPQGLTIGPIYASMPDSDWVAKHVPRDDIAEVRDFEKALKAAGRSTTDLAVGQILLIDGVRIEVLGVKNPEFTQNCLNNSSVVLRVSDKAKSVLFLGDLGFEGGEKAVLAPPAATSCRPTTCKWPTTARAAWAKTCIGPSIRRIAFGPRPAGCGTTTPARASAPAPGGRSKSAAGWPS